MCRVCGFMNVNTQSAILSAQVSPSLPSSISTQPVPPLAPPPYTKTINHSDSQDVCLKLSCCGGRVRVRAGVRERLGRRGSICTHAFLCV